MAASTKSAAGPRSRRAEEGAQFSSYDHKLITAFEIVVAYFADVAFNHIYSASKANMSKKSDGGSLTDEYRRQVQAFLVGVKSDEVCYKDVIQNLYKYFASVYSAVSFSQFVDRVVSHFVPQDYFERLTL